MDNIAEIIRTNLVERINLRSDSPISCRVESVGGNDYEALFVCSGVTLIYDILDVQDSDDLEEPAYSGIVKLQSCVTEFSADHDTNYYLDAFNRYQDLCNDVAKIMDMIDTYFDDSLTYFYY